ncbi:MAG: tRNA (adenosine(37)-N6)-threonylcarbamoyltransferase complex transferase subunit TsaD [Sumerlaeia bacterium]
MTTSTTNQPFLILGVESSCDETAFAVVESTGRVLSNTIASQVELHARYGGVVPEIASRAHLEACVPLYQKALAEAYVHMEQITAIAATQGPGLSGCLLVGFEFAKGLALRHNKPLVPVHHIAGHADSVYLGKTENAWGHSLTQAQPPFQPYVALVISGGHSSLIAVHAPLKYEILGQTMDDAVGEAYDKIAKLMGLPYPGGPLLDRLAQLGDPNAFKLTLPLSRASDDREACMFSFSGLKTAVARYVEAERKTTGEEVLDANFINNLAAAFQQTAVESLAQKTKNALKKTGYKRLAITGGVACNSHVRTRMKQALRGIKIAIPAPEYCTDNAAMIAGLGARCYQQQANQGLGLNVKASWSIEEFG